MDSRPASTAEEWQDFFRDVNRLTPLALVYWTAMIVFGAALALLWRRNAADHPVYGLLVGVWTGLLGPGLAVPILTRLPESWFRVHAGERVLHRVLGVGAFAWMLRRSGYDRQVVHPMWQFSVNRAGLRWRAQAARGGATAHGASFLIHVVLAALAVAVGSRWRAFWILLPGVVMHFYPVLLQRAILLRLQPLTGRLGRLGSDRESVVLSRSGTRIDGVAAMGSDREKSKNSRSDPTHPTPQRQRGD